MKRFILLSFALLGLGFYELSGGAGFDPEKARMAQIEARQDRNAARIAALPDAPPAQDRVVAASQEPDPATPEQQVTRAALNLVSFETVTQSDNPEGIEGTTAPASAAPAAAISELAAEEELSLAALDNASPSGQNIAFAGNSLAASSANAAQELDIRTVTGSLVNMRSGPGTEYEVVDQLSQSTRVEVLTDTGNGWVELRPVEGGASGWMAAFLLSDG